MKSFLFQTSFNLEDDHDDDPPKVCIKSSSRCIFAFVVGMFFCKVHMCNEKSLVVKGI